MACRVYFPFPEVLSGREKSASPLPIPPLSLTLSPPLVFAAFIAVQRVSSLEIRWQCKNQGEEFKSKLKLIFMPRFQGDRF